MKMDKPFKDLIVLELASVLAGPLVGMYFAELGASVIKVENILTKGDVTRKWKIPTEQIDPDISSYFTAANWGKQSIALNLKKTEGLDLVHKLAKKADILVASYKPGDAEKLKVDYKTIKELKSNIIYAHVTGFGQKSSRPGYDAIVQAESGFTYLNGEPDGPPLKMPVAMTDIITGHQAKEAILTALYIREKTGKGQYIDVNLFQSGVSTLANQATNWLVGQKVPERMGSEHPNIVPYGTMYKTQDETDIILAVGNDRQFKVLCQVLNQPELAHDPLYSTNIKRMEHRYQLHQVLGQLISQWKKSDLLNTLAEHNVPAGGVNKIPEVFELEGAKELLLQGKTKTNIPITGLRTVSFARNKEVKPPPHYGEHTESILSDHLKLTQDKIQELFANKVIEK